MDLKSVLSIGGRPGLYKILSQTRSGWVVASLQDNKKIPIFSHDKVSSLEEISIFTETTEVPLKQVFINIFEYANGQKTISHKSDGKTLKDFFAQVLPDYDEDRVYVSDIKKIVSWYNTLIETDVINAKAVEEAQKPVEAEEEQQDTE